MFKNVDIIKKMIINTSIDISIFFAVIFYV